MMLNFGYSKPRLEAIEKYSFPVVSLADSAKHTIKLNSAAHEILRYNELDESIKKRISIATDENGKLCLVNTSLAPINNSSEFHLHKNGVTFNSKKLYKKLEDFYGENADIYGLFGEHNGYSLVSLEEIARDHETNSVDNISDGADDIDFDPEDLYLNPQENYDGPRNYTDSRPATIQGDINVVHRVNRDLVIEPEINRFENYYSGADSVNTLESINTTSDE